jgi:hypothetical protein
VRSAILKVFGGLTAVIVLAVTGLMLTLTAARLEVATVEVGALPPASPPADTSIGTRRQKHDRRDAALLLQLLAEDRFPTIWMPSTELRGLRALLLHVLNGCGCERACRMRCTRSRWRTVCGAGTRFGIARATRFRFVHARSALRGMAMSSAELRNKRANVLGLE